MILADVIAPNLKISFQCFSDLLGKALCGLWRPKQRAMMVEIALMGRTLKTCAIVLGLRILQANSSIAGLQSMLREN